MAAPVVIRPSEQLPMVQNPDQSVIVPVPVAPAPQTMQVGSLYSVADVPDEQRLARREFISFKTRGEGLASVLLLMRFLVYGLGFISIVLDWVSRYDYENVVLGIISLGMITVLALSDIPGLWDNVRIVRTSGVAFTRTFFRLSIFLAFLTLSLARGYGGGLVSNPALVVPNTTYAIVVSCITGVVTLVTFFSWLFYFRSHGNPDIHEVGAAFKRVTLPVTSTQTFQPVGQNVPVQEAAAMEAAGGGVGSNPFVTQGQQQQQLYPSMAGAPQQGGMQVPGDRASMQGLTSPSGGPATTTVLTEDAFRV